MPVEPIELIKLLLGIALITIPGYLWSFLFSKYLTFFERVLFGFLVTIGILTSTTFVINVLFNIKMTLGFILILFAIYTVPVLIIYGIALRKFGLPKITFHPLKNKKYLVLLVILVFSAFMVFLPHLTNNYYLPFHVDEWEHLTYSRALIQNGNTTFPSPYTGEGTGFYPEIGFYITTAVLHWLSGSDLITITVFMPALLAIALSLIAYVLGERTQRKFGLEAAFLVAFIPTTVRFLGPSFYVTSTLGLVLLLFIFWLAQLQKIQGTLLISALLWYLFVIHPPTALAVVIILFIYTVFLVLEKKFKIAFFIGFFISLPLILVYYFTTRWNSAIDVLLKGTLGERYILGLNLPRIWIDFQHLGIITWIFLVIGLYFSISKGKALVRTLSFSAISFILIIGLYDRFGYGIPIIYERTFLYLFLIVALTAGFGISELRRYIQTVVEKIQMKKITRYKKYLGYLVPVTVVIILLFTAVPAHIEIPYYTMINETEYTSFTWINNNIHLYRDANHSYERAAVDPYKASPFTAVTGIHTISTSMSPLYGYELAGVMEQFLNEKCVNTNFLNTYRLSVVYGECNNTNLTMIHEKVYIYPGLSKT
jgi:hypothetical protein